MIRHEDIRRLLRPRRGVRFWLCALAAAGFSVAGGVRAIAGAAPDSVSAASDTASAPGAAASKLDSLLALPDSVRAAIVDSARAARGDTIVPALPPTRQIPVLRRSRPLDEVLRERYFWRHATSLDQYLEGMASIVLARPGPIVRQARFSRWGIGRGRGVVTLDGIELNNPQNGVAPLVEIPLSTVGEIRFGDGAAGRSISEHSIEGSINLYSPPPPTERPVTFIESSDGTRNLRQRRVRFSSIASDVGIDLTYDEVLNDGYSFDARELVGVNFNDFGRGVSRNIGARVRGRLEGGASYATTFRRFEASSTGDLVSSTREHRRSGNLGMLDAGFGPVRLTLFGRGYHTEAPDSSSSNQTNGVAVALSPATGQRLDVVLRAGVEDIDSHQEVAGLESNDEVLKVSGAVNTRLRVARNMTLHADASAVQHQNITTGFGASVELFQALGRGGVGVGARRSYRMPSMSELYGPPHVSGPVIMSGAETVDAEYAYEASARWVLAAGPVTNEVRGTGVRMKEPILYRQADVGGQTWWVAQNSGGEYLTFLEDRVRVDAKLFGLDAVADGGVAVAIGERQGYFASTPELRYTASLRVGRSLFEATSALYAGVQFVHGGERRDFSGLLLPDYQVINLTLDGRLLDAKMYLVWHNLLDEQYTTDGNSLMTPQTFLFGIAWSLFE